MIRKVQKYIEDQKFLTEYKNGSESKMIVGVSGGADSMVLLFILNRMGYTCVAAHCNFHLRGEESIRDEKTVEQFARNINVPFIKQDFNTIAHAASQGISIEMAARNLRYEWFEQIRQEQQADVIAVAHHSNDSIETFLLNTIRGTGIKGLTGIPPQNGKIIRPLLSLSKEDILSYAQKEHIPYTIDSSNLQDEFTRNKIRLFLLPLLEKINPSVNMALLRTMEHLIEVEKAYIHEIEQEKKAIFDRKTLSIDIPRLKNSASPESVLFEILKDFNFDRVNIKNIFETIDSQSGKEFYSPEYGLIKDREQFLLFPRNQKTDHHRYLLEETTTMITFPLSLQMTFEDMDVSFPIKKENTLAYFDAGKLEFPLIIRKWKHGDKLMPFGMQGFQKVSDYFNNKKISIIEKQKIWLLCSGENIIWIIGYRTDERYKIDHQTQKVCMIKLL